MSEPQLLVSISKKFGGSTGFIPPKINIAPQVKNVDEGRVPLPFWEARKNLEYTHYIFTSEFLSSISVCEICEVLVDYSKKNILAYVTHTETCLKSTKLAGKYIQLTWCFTYIMCLRSFSPFGVCSTTQVQCPPGIGWSFQEHGWPWKPSLGEQLQFHSNFKQTWHFKRMKQQFCVVVEPPCWNICWWTS